MNERPLRVVHLEDAAEDGELVHAALEDGGIACDIARVDTEEGFAAAIGGDVDLILSDYALPGFDGMKALELAKSRRPEVPFLFVTGALSDDSAVETLRRGATDFVVKGRLNRLAPAIRRAVREREERARVDRAHADNALLNARLKEALRQRDEILAVVSHDLRSPLANMVFSAATLKSGGVTRERTQQIAGMIGRSASRMNRIIGDLLDVASLEAGTLAIETRPFDVGALLRESVEAHAPMAEQKGIRLDVRVGTGITALGDAERVLQVLANLVGNALKFTPAGGTITLSADRDGDTVRVMISDSGPGIAPDQAGLVFDRYWHGNEQNRSSVGLGLYIVKCLVEAQGGHVSVSSEPGRGAAFTFTLRASASAPVEVNPRRAAVLIVDDDDMIRESLAESLREAGYAVLLAKDGIEALEQLRSQRAALIILDLMMPRMNGIEFRRIQGDDPTLATIPTVIITAADGVADRPDFRAPEALVPKPLQIRDLLSLVERMTSSPSPSRLH